MKSAEQRIGEAEAALAHRLNTFGVEDPHAKAHEFITELLREGWRPVAHAVHRPTKGEKHAHPNTAARECQVAREAIREARAEWAAAKEEHA